MNIINADCLEAMRGMEAASVDSIVTDPPYGLSFMGKDWDHGVPGEGFWKEALRIAKPGAHLLAFGGSRTYHRLACAIEDAGWEIRDCIMWVYGSGFPKSMDVAKAIDKSFGKEGEIVGYKNQSDIRGGALMNTQGKCRIDVPVRAAATPEVAAWQGWGTCLKPAYEPIIVARKPLDGTVADNVLKHGTGALNIDACRVPYESVTDKELARPQGRATANPGCFAGKVGSATERKGFTPTEAQGRFPANFCHDGSQMLLDLFPDNVKGGTWQRTDGARHFNNNGEATNCECWGKDASVGSAARFFYCAKASRSERGEGNDHPTVKPVALMRWLVRLVTRKGGVVLDPFCGSGTTGLAAHDEGMDFIGIEKDPHYAEIAKRRIGA